MQCKIEVPGEGPKHARLMLVGEAPGKNEVLQKRPFVGRAGKFLNKTLDEVKIARAACYVTNVVKFRPTQVVQGKIAAPGKSAGAGKLRIARSGKQGGRVIIQAAPVKIRDRPPTDTEMAACAPILKREILSVKPKMIVLLGSTALRAVVGPEEKISECHGQMIVRKQLTFLPTYHPAAAMRNRKIRRSFIEDLRKAKRFQNL